MVGKVSTEAERTHVYVSMRRATLTTQALTERLWAPEKPDM
jgi:hypothetical protein